MKEESEVQSVGMVKNSGKRYNSSIWALIGANEV